MTDVRVTHIGGPTVLIEVHGWQIERELAATPDDIRRRFGVLPIGEAVALDG